MNKYNSKGYHDPTAYEALLALEQQEKVAKVYLPLVYIASPYAGDTEQHVLQARRFCFFAVSKGCIPLAPHLLYPQFMDDEDKGEREMGLRFALILLAKCDELWMFGERVSEGMSKEILEAKRKGIPIRTFNRSCEEVTP